MIENHMFTTEILPKDQNIHTTACTIFHAQKWCFFHSLSIRYISQGLKAHLYFCTIHCYYAIVHVLHYCGLVFVRWLICLFSILNSFSIWMTQNTNKSWSNRSFPPKYLPTKCPGMSYNFETIEWEKTRSYYSRRFKIQKENRFFLFFHFKFFFDVYCTETTHLIFGANDMPWK